MKNTKAAANKKLARDWFRAIVDAGLDSKRDPVAAAYAPDAKWRGSHPLNEMQGIDAIADKVWAPIKRAMRDGERRDTLIVGGEWDGADYVGAVGMIVGTFTGEWLGIYPTNRVVYLRYGEYHKMRDGKIVESAVIFDILDFMRQAGFWPLPPSLGVEGMWPAPFTGDGLNMEPNDSEQSAQSLKMVMDMHHIINTYDDVADCSRAALLEMPQKDCWHNKMMWYGPAGIGTCRKLEGYVDYHQRPFRLAFPNRKAVGHYARIGDGPFAATGGWPSVSAVHSGGDFMGLPPTGRAVTMRVMDFYLCDEGLIRENWIPLDMLDLLMQMGVDVFARGRALGFVRR